MAIVVDWFISHLDTILILTGMLFATAFLHLMLYKIWLVLDLQLDVLRGKSDSLAFTEKDRAYWHLAHAKKKTYLSDLNE